MRKRRETAKVAMGSRPASAVAFVVRQLAQCV
jgi:hypothetical protein